MNTPYVFKQCSKCNRILHISRYGKKKTCKYGVNSYCKECKRNEDKEYHKKHRDEALIKQKIYRECHKQEISKSKKIWYENNKEECSKKRREYKKNHKKEISEYGKDYYIKNKDRISEYKKDYYANNPQATFNSNSRRRTKEESQGNGITKEQWLEMMEFFQWTCAYSGEYLGGNNKDKKRTIDHIVALDNGGEHEIWNCVPMLKSYNTSKHTNNILEWYIEQPFFSIERLTKIYEWRMYAYEKWGK